jgi:excinuclease UvrABC nuclease subunit
MDQAERRAVPSLKSAEIPTSPGVYALYRNGERMYLGKATSLRMRLGSHRSKGVSMTNSALRRNICEHLRIATAAAIKARRYSTTRADAGSVTGWLAEGSFSWIECESPAAAVALEEALLREFKPPLNRL